MGGKAKGTKDVKEAKPRKLLPRKLRKLMKLRKPMKLRKVLPMKVLPTHLTTC